MYEGACMSAQHKTLPDVTGTGRGWVMTQRKLYIILLRQVQLD